MVSWPSAPGVSSVQVRKSDRSLSSAGERLDLPPLVGEVDEQIGGARIGEQPIGLGQEAGLRRELSGAGRGEQLVVGRRAPVSRYASRVASA